jgi:hypothetical protein
MPCFSSTGSSLRNGPKSRRLRCGGAQRADEVVGLEGRGQKAKVDESNRLLCGHYRSRYLVSEGRTLKGETSVRSTSIPAYDVGHALLQPFRFPGLSGTLKRYSRYCPQQFYLRVLDCPAIEIARGLESRVEISRWGQIKFISIYRKAELHNVRRETDLPAFLPLSLIWSACNSYGALELLHFVVDSIYRKFLNPNFVRYAWSSTTDS